MSLLLMAAHVGLLCASVMAVGVQSAELHRIRSHPMTTDSSRSAKIAMLSISILCPEAAITGIPVGADRAESEIWTLPYALSTAAIVVMSLATRLQLRRLRARYFGRLDFGRRSGLPGATQYGVPAFLAVTVFLLIARPQNLLTAWTPVVPATAVTLTAWLATRKPADTFAEIAHLREALNLPGS
ncbi:hypothetical protein ACIBCN_16180 [Nocardia sp. NPDC051052]|uniref:hypothetical protein n=1 Tax=Nocardia sp. NPDC051052 TaxID=3364322 RepID=UPI0037AD169F